MIRRLFIFVFLLHIAVLISTAQHLAFGKVIDSVTGAPLAFVNILVNDNDFGGSTDIDGNFYFKSPTPIQTLTFKFVGYNPVVVKMTAPAKSLKILMLRKSLELSGVEIYPGENPAHNIIRKVQANKKINNPENIPLFKYNCYNKVVAEWYLDKTKYTISSNPDSKLKDDSTFLKMSRLADEQHIMMLEAFTERIYKDGKSQETVLGTKVSGFTDANFTTLATDIQPFSFYTDFISLSITDVKDYLNPISNGSIGRYSFILEDTLFDGNDSVFVISFMPMKGKNFNALKGVLYINSNRYAIQNVIAQPAEEGLWSIKIQQLYTFVDNKYWFPSQLNYDWLLPNYPSEKVGVVMKGRSYISDVNFSPELKNSNFGPSNLVFENGAGSRNADFWQNSRKDSLTAKEIKTYHVIDSLGKKHKFDYYSLAIEKILEGYIPLSFLDFSLEELFNYNNIEGVRIGLGLRTNEKLCRWFTIGGFGAYGFWDKKFKYGGNFEFTLSKKHEIFIGAYYLKDLETPGMTDFVGFRNFSYWNEFLIDRIDFAEKLNIYFNFRTLRYAQFEISGLHENRNPEYPYYYLPTVSDTFAGNIHKYTELKIGVRYAHDEKLIDAFNKRYTLGTKYPVLYLTYIHGFKGLLGGQFNYDKLELALEKEFLIKHLGKTYLFLEAGYIWGEVPYTKLFKGKGSYTTSFVFYFRNTFQTMRIDEFLYDRYFAFHFRHSFGNYLFKGKKFRPEPNICQSILYGELSHKEYHSGIDFKVPDKWYFESGLMFDNLLRLKLFNLAYLKLGVGVFYRYGAYAFDNELKNFALKLSFKISGSR
ncbi:MAG: DUF5686 family protein [Bacteroidales bacterium]|jgi:hypothetical protein|nr:DUF5686 family protein [Bacteroidales bacterium]